MAQPASVVWAEPPFLEYTRLPSKTREQINARLQLLKLFPELYQVEIGGRWEGLRRMPVGWHRLYYTYWHENHTLYIDALVTYTE